MILNSNHFIIPLAKNLETVHNLPVYHPLDGNVSRRRVGHLFLARRALAGLNQLAVALLANDVRVLALVNPPRPHDHANRTLQLAQELASLSA